VFSAQNIQKESNMSDKMTVERIGDMHPTRSLRLKTQRSGDVVVMICQGGFPIGDIDLGNVATETAQIEFCMNGGKSPRTLQALRDLQEAIRLDNEEYSIAPR
jgi:hypothetical protein